jgi:hypothetical protein
MEEEVARPVLEEEVVEPEAGVEAVTEALGQVKAETDVMVE